MKAWALIMLLAIVIAVGVACAARHPVQRVSKHARAPLGCKLRGDQVRIAGQTFVTVECAEGLALVNAKTREVAEFVSWDEIGK